MKTLIRRARRTPITRDDDSLTDWAIDRWVVPLLLPCGAAMSVIVRVAQRRGWWR